VSAASRNFGEAHLSAADGVVAYKSHSGLSDHPVRSNTEASRHFLDVAATPPHEEGNTRMQEALHSSQPSQTHSLRRALCMIPADMKVFISHSSKNEKVAGRLCDDLRRKKIEVWLDRDQLHSGDPLIDDLQAAITESTYFLLLWSKPASESRYVKPNGRQLTISKRSSSLAFSIRLPFLSF